MQAVMTITASTFSFHINTGFIKDDIINRVVYNTVPKIICPWISCFRKFVEAPHTYRSNFPPNIASSLKYSYQSLLYSLLSRCCVVRRSSAALGTSTFSSPTILCGASLMIDICLTFFIGFI
uniref:Uncharacterized protein n=1 Tax=Parascaris univalens TaxID=6257 RepID=A0A915CBI5_PARUN